MQKQIRTANILVKASTQSFLHSTDAKNCFTRVFLQEKIIDVLNRVHAFYNGVEMTSEEIQTLKKDVDFNYRQSKALHLPLLDKESFDKHYGFFAYASFLTGETSISESSDLNNPLFTSYKFLQLNMKRETRYRQMLQNLLKHTRAHLDRAYSLSL